MIANLIDNARIHGDSEARISLEIPTHQDMLSNCSICVEDHGPGVPERERAWCSSGLPGVLPRTTFIGDGSGLGLALVAEHVRLHKGRVWVEDRHDGQPGARFVIELPAEEVEVE